MQSSTFFDTYIGSLTNSQGEKVDIFEDAKGEHFWITYLKDGAKMIERNETAPLRLAGGM